MKPQSALACLFVVYGIHLAIKSLITVAVLVSIAHHQLAQTTFAVLPLAGGIILAWKSQFLGALVARIAGSKPDETWSLALSPRELCGVLLCVLGAWLVISSMASVLQDVVMLFVSLAGNQEIGHRAASNISGDLQIITQVAKAAGGVWLLKKSRAISIRLGF